MKFKTLLFAAGAAALLSAGSASAAIDVLWYTGGTEASGPGTYEAAMSALATPGAGDPSSATWNITYWTGGATPAGSYDVLVVASPEGGWSSYPDYTALNAAGLTFGDRVMATGQDADWHDIFGPGSTDFNGPRGFLRDAINWAGSGTGMGVVALSATSFLDAYGFSATLGPSSGSTNDVVIPAAYAAYPINTNLTSAGLSNWSTSAHEIWDSYDSTEWTCINTAGSAPGAGCVTLVTAKTAGGGIGGVVPEPGAWALMLLGVAGLGATLRLHRRADDQLKALKA